MIRSPLRRWWPLLALAAVGAGIGAALLLVEAPREAVKLLWTFEAKKRGAIVSTPLVAENRIYVGVIQDGLVSTGKLFCLDRDTGSIIWEFDDDGAMQHMYSSPCLADGRLYIGEGMHANFVCKLYCLDAATGKKHWHFETAGHIESSPCVAAGKVYFGSGDDGLYCADTTNGAKCWHFHGPFHIDSSPVVVGKRVYAGSGMSRNCKTTEAFCLDADSGAVVWRTPTSLPVWGSPRVDGGQVFFGLGNGRLDRSAAPPEVPAGALLCVDAASGEPLWSCNLEDAVLARPALDDRHVFYGARDGCCHCVKRATGEPVWKQHLGSAIVTSPALRDGRLYVAASDGRVACLDAATGRERWRLDLGRMTKTKPQLFSSPVVVSSGDNHRRIHLGTELRNPVTCAAVLYCWQD